MSATDFHMTLCGGPVSFSRGATTRGEAAVTERDRSGEPASAHTRIWRRLRELERNPQMRADYRFIC